MLVFSDDYVARCELLPPAKPSCVSNQHISVSSFHREADQICVPKREYGNQRCVVVLNMTSQTQQWQRAEMAAGLTAVFSTQSREDNGKTAVLELAPNEGILLLPD